MAMRRTVFFVSDRTGITAEMLGNSMLVQFDAMQFARQTIPFVDSPEKVEEVIEQINETAAREGERPIVFSSVVDDAAAERGLASGELTSDTRLRDALRAIASGATPPEAPAPTLAEDVAFAVEAQAMLEHDGWVKLTGRAERLERGLDALARSPLTR